MRTARVAAMELRTALPTKKKRQERERDSNERDRGTVKEPNTLKVKLARRKDSQLRVVS